ncbi:MAG: dihydroorotase, partial [Conexivisphaera sp.]
AIRRIALFALRTGGRALIVHVSSREGIEAIREAREQGARVYGETCPHYLVLDSSAYSRYGSLIKVNPPIRTSLDMEALWDAVNSEVITSVGSDHAPHTPEEKRGSIWDAASGIIGVQTMLPILLDSALKGRTTISRVVRLVSEMPARLFGLYGRKGVIAPGADADLVVFDPSKGFSIREEWLYSRSKISPFIGWELRGKIERVYLRGNEIYDGESVTERHGEFIRA